MIKSGLLGVAVGDALGVPVEFTSRDSLRQNPVTGMREFGSHHQPKGTWSDDSSMTFCTAESLLNGYNLKAIADSFGQWYYDNYWTPHGRVFDKGGTTEKAIWCWAQLKESNPDESPALAGGRDVYDNGNGSLMRILPMAYYVQNLLPTERQQVVFDVSSITHAHFRSKLCCWIYIEVALGLIQGKTPQEAYTQMQHIVNEHLDNFQEKPQEKLLFQRILDLDIAALQEKDIRSSGYVLHTLEASLWCLLKYDNFTATVLAAVNLGEDTDTTGAVAGGLAGLLYGWQSIPSEWIDVLAKLDDILALTQKMELKFGKQ